MWESISGHCQIIAMLQTMLDKKRLPHALLFAGPSGVGKAMTARVLAASLLCGSKEPCGSCSSCIAFTRQSHAGLFSIMPDRGNIKIDQIRALNREASLGAALGEARVCIIHDAEKMTLQAANSLLKLLEEPPRNFYFILVASSAHALPGTILSRCLTANFRPLPPAVLAQVLTERGFACHQAQAAAAISGGRFGQALKLLEPGGLDNRNKALLIVETVTTQQGSWFFSEMTLFDKRSSNDHSEILRYMSMIFRDMALLRSSVNKELLLNSDCRDQLYQMACQWPEKSLIKASNRIRDAYRALASNANTKMTWEALILELAHMAKEEETGANRCWYTV